MPKQDFEIRFEKARARLNAALKELEKTATDKLVPRMIAINKTIESCLKK